MLGFLPPTTKGGKKEEIGRKRQRERRNLRWVPEKEQEEEEEKGKGNSDALQRWGSSTHPDAGRKREEGEGGGRSRWLPRNFCPTVVFSDLREKTIF